MKRQTILEIVATIAIVLIALFVNGYVFFGLLIWLPIIVWRVKKKKDEPDKAEMKPLTLAEAVTTYGESDESIVADATRANEAAGCILVYKQKRVLVIAGEPIAMDCIKDVTCVNTATPYTFGQYQVVLTTTIPDRQYIRFDVGMDQDWANNVAMGIIDAMK